MAEPNSWLLLGDVETCLKRIKVADGFHTDVGNYVTREPHQIPDAAGAVVAVAMGEIQPAADPRLARTHKLVNVLVIAKVGTAGDPQLHLHYLIDDIEQAFKDQQQAFGKGRSFPQFVSATPIPPKEGIAWIGAQVRYTSHVTR
jgi:hypothetical protein